MSRLYDILAQLVKADRRTLLWSNPNQNESQSFAAQTINNLNFTGYDCLEVYITDRISFRIPKDADQYLYSAKLSGTGLGYVQTSGRMITVGSTSITFGGGYYNYGHVATASASDYSLIPLKIYGIKLGGGLKSPDFNGLCRFLVCEEVAA